MENEATKSSSNYYETNSKPSDSASAKQNKKSKSKSPDKKGSKSAKSSKSGKSTGSKSRSPKRKQTAHSHKSDLHNESSLYYEAPKSTPELEDMSSQGLTIINSKIFQKITLKTLILSNNNLRSIPSAIADLVNLEYLDLSKNPLRVKDVDDSKCLPLDMRLLKNLKYLSISECNLRYIPTTVWLCTSLNVLDLSRNKIGLLVPDIGNLQKLTHLNLSQCNLTTLPAEIGFCCDLIEIILMANQIESLPDSLKDCTKLANLKMSYRSFCSLLDSYMESLISKGQIKSEHVPLVIFELENLHELNLKSTKINNLPENSLKNLNNLLLDDNYFDNFVDLSLKPMYSTLKILTISNNLLKDIPNEILNLKNLEILDLGGNKITQFPAMFNLPNLKELYLNNNNLKYLNSSISCCKLLEKLRLDKNELVELPDGLYSLTNLIYLDLSYNKLRTISSQICSLKHIKTAHSYLKLNKTGLWVIENILEIPPKEIWQTQNIDKIYEYLSSYAQRNLKHVFYSKLIFLGSSGVGKSNLVDSFFSTQSKSSSTDYRTVCVRKFYKRTINKVEWFILDFGGEQIYKSLHSTFFSSIDQKNEPCIFIIVYNNDEYSTDKHYSMIGNWIESVLIHTANCSDSPINLKLVGLSSKKDQQNLEIVLENSKKTVDFYLNNFNSKRKINLITDITLLDKELNKNDIDKILLELENLTIGLNKTVPFELNTILKVHLPKLRKKYISINELRESLEVNSNIKNLCLKNKNLDLDSILNYSKTIGQIFWFKSNSKLKDKIFLHFDYLVNCLKLFIRHDLKEILSQSSVFKSCGIFKDNKEFLKSLSLFKKFGILELKMVKYISFSGELLNEEEIKESLDLLEEFLIIYKSETEYLEDKCYYFSIIEPVMCCTSYFKKMTTSWDSVLYGNEFYKYFIRLDQIRNHWEEEKEANAIRKRKLLWETQENELMENEFIDMSNEPRKSVTDSFSFEYNIVDENGNFNFKDEDELSEKYEFKSKLVIKSGFKIELHMFHKFSNLLQSIVYERFDWIDTIIARDVNNSCFRMKLDQLENSIKVEFVCLSKQNLDDLNSNFLNLIENFFKDNYPGFCFRNDAFTDTLS